MLDFPSGTVTLLFTDIEGSTRLLQRLGDQYIVLLAECRYLLRSAFRQWNGHEVDTQGDSFFVAFANARDAVTAASMAQRLLYTHTWPEGVAVRIRMGIHTGEPVLVSEGYIGIDVHRAARIMSAGHGGQVLLSQRSRGLVEQFLPPDVSLRDMGEHELKDLQHPEHLYQLVIADLPADFPPLKTLSSLPAIQTSTVKSTEGNQSEKVYALAWSPDRRYIASGGHDRTVKVWKSTTKLVATTYRGHASSIMALAWSPDGQYIASASLDKTLHVWSALPNEGVPVEQHISTYKNHPGMIGAVTWSPDGRHIASTSSGGTDTTVHIWEATTGRTLLIYKGHTYWVRALAWSPDGRFIASGSLKEVQIWDVSTGHKIFTYHGHEGWVKAIRWEPGGQYRTRGRIASSGEDKTVQVWSPNKDRALVTYRGHDEWVDCMEWSPDAMRIASVGKDNSIQVWDAASGGNTLTFQGHADSTHALAWLPDGKHLASISGDGVVQLWKGA
jgi:WD40 repeat protein